MRAAIAVSALLVAISANLQAQTVIQNSNLLFAPNTDLPPANYAFTAYQRADRSDWTSVWFKYDGSHLQLINTNIDEGSDWYIVHSGDEFSRANIAAGQFPTLAKVSLTNGTPIPGPSLTVGSGDFWLGTATGTVLFGDRTVYGWAHMHPVGSVLTMVDNAMSYNSLGIVVGTTTVVPEPATISTAICSLLWGFTARRGRKK